MEEIKSIPVEKNVRVSAQLEKLTESLRDWMQRPAPMKNLVKFARHAQAANRHFNDAVFGQLVADRNARQDRDPESRHQSFFDRFRAADGPQPPDRRFSSLRLYCAPHTWGTSRAAPKLYRTCPKCCA